MDNQSSSQLSKIKAELDIYEHRLNRFLQELKMKDNSDFEFKLKPKNNLDFSFNKVEPDSEPRIPLPKLRNGEIFLNLGCGETNHPKFVNIDIRPAPHIHYVRPIDDLSIFKDNSVDLIYSSHCLEHFSHLKVPSVLAEWYRVIKPEGILRLSVPDFDKIITIYKKNDNNINSILGKLMGGQNYEFNYHKTVFNQASLEKSLKTAKFNKIQVWQPESDDLTDLKDGSRSTVSLNLEAIK